MNVFWIGMNDDTGCVQQWHELRQHLRDEHGVHLIGPGYSGPMGVPVSLKAAVASHDEPDWIVFDDCNAMGYPNVHLDVPLDKIKIAWREHDWHNRARRGFADLINPDLILACADRPLLKSMDKYRNHPEWHLVPHPINIDVYYPGNGQYRNYAVGLYGKTGACYKTRTAAKLKLKERQAQRGDVFLPTHGGYWRDGRGSCEGVTYYNGELAAALREVTCLWVDGSDYDVFLQKYHEGIASGCLLVGERPYRFENYYPDGCMVDCAVGDIDDIVDWYAEHPGPRQEITSRAWEYCKEKHSIPARARQIMALLEEAR